MKREILITKDGSQTIAIAEMNVTYHSIHGAMQESKHVFIETGLMPFIQLQEYAVISIFEMGLGTGLNALLTYEAAEQLKQKIDYTSIELFPLQVEEYQNLQYANKKMLQQLHAYKWERDIMLSDYFNTFADRVLRKINQQKVSEELQEISPFLAKLSKENVYKIPQHYFNSLQSLEAVKVENKVKSISTRFVSKWISYAAAAVITGVLITGAYMYTNHKGNFDLTNEINKVSDEELQNYLSLSIAHPAAVANEETTSNINAPETLDVKQEMQFVSDEELQEYINENYETQKNTDQQQLNVGS